MFVWSKGFSDRGSKENGEFSSGEKLPVKQIFCVGLASDNENLQFVCEWVTDLMEIFW